ncbi:redox-regulated ATPase YchF [Actinomycetota bacterium]
MKLGIVGLPNVGKSTLFNAITAAGAEISNYPFCTIEPNRATVPVPDPRLEKLAEMVKPEKVIPATIEFVDIAGLVKGAHKGEGLGNKFLSHIREVDAIVHTVRCFSDESISHVSGTLDPVSDIEVVDLELIFADIETINNRLEKNKRQAKTRDKIILFEIDILQKVKANLEGGKPVRSMDLSGQEKEVLDTLFLLTLKPVLYAANISEEDIGKSSQDNEELKKVQDFARSVNSEVLIVSAKIEEELSRLDPDERELFVEELGIHESGIDRLIKSSYKLMDLISFLTIKLPEVRAWTVARGTRAPQAAGKIHTDFEKGFICAETIGFKTLMEAGTFNSAKERGLVRHEGKDYIINNGDVILFRFNV